MEKKVVTCTICPIGCSIEVSEDKDSTLGYMITGNSCKRGIDYTITEVTNPSRILTSTVKLKNSRLSRLPVRTDKPIPRELMIPCMRLINSVEIDAPVKLGDMIIKNILSTGVNIISSRTI